jgi:hypothetical protein
MKSLFATAVLTLTVLSGALAQAESLQIKRIGNSFEFSGSSFRFDGASAWIDIEMTREIPPGRSCYDESGSTVGYFGPASTCGHEYEHRTESALVSGLRYDAAAAQIFHVSKDGKKTVCATVTEKRRRFRRDLTVLTFTGSCRISTARDAGGTSIYLNIE